MLKKLTPKVYGFTINFQALISKKAAAKRAFEVYSKVRNGQVLPLQKTFLDKAKHELLQISDCDIQTYHWPGNGERILLVHGWESNVYRWRILIKELQTANYDIFAFDAPANGNSSGKRLHHSLYESVLQKIKLHYKPKFLIGHSMGGMTIMYNQYINPDEIIKKIITIASPSEYTELMRYYKNLLSLSDSVMSGIEDYVKTNFGFNFQEFSTANFAKTNSKKGLLIHDKQDPSTPYWSSELVHANWKNSKFITTTGLGHSIQNNNVNKQIIDFLKS